MKKNISGSFDLWCQKLDGQKVGKYTLNKFIGKGKIGYVYSAVHIDFPDSYRAVKLIFDTLHKGWDTELKKVIKLELVDGVVHFHEHNAETLTNDGQSHLAQYTVWDFVAPGENLKQYLERVKDVRVSFLLAVIEQILRVLNACYHAGIIRHGDLHAGNILIGEQSSARLDDTLQPRAPIYVSDFGFRTTGSQKQPKDDYLGLIEIINQILSCIN